MRAWVDVDGPPWTVAEHGCWLWDRKVDATGYGHVPLGKHRQLFAHRWVYELAVGPIPDGLELDHLCRVRRCVNPDHLEPVTSAENVRRAPRTKLDTEAVDEIRRRYAAGGVTHEALAAEFGVCRSNVSMVLSGRNWRT